jgi:hypothetical protein
VQNDRFIWDEEKHIANIRKHKVTFNEATSVFDDDNAIYFNDESHSQDEDINYDDIPKITDFSKGRKNPFAGRFKDGYTIIVEHKDHNEIITVKKTTQDNSRPEYRPATRHQALTPRRHTKGHHNRRRRNRSPFNFNRC